MNLLTTKEASEKLGVSVRRVQAMITDGSDYVIKETDLELVKDRKPGRPSKDKTKE
jgi:excisionase family DNA binding protein